MRRCVIGVVVVGLAVALTGPAFATGKQVICWDTIGGSYIPFYGASRNAMRYQALIDQLQIKYAGNINQVELHSWRGTAGTFYDYKLILCHCGSGSLSATFASNYKGTPVTVANLSTFNILALPGWFGLGMTTTPFTYNNTDHLLIEIQWNRDNNVNVGVDFGSLAAGYHRLWVDNPQGSQGTLDRYTCYTRLSFGAYTAGPPTSLGRVKAIFK